MPIGLAPAPTDPLSLRLRRAALHLLATPQLHKVGSEVCLVGEKSCQACSVVMVGGGWEAGGWAAYERCRCVGDSWGVRLRWRKDGPTHLTADHRTPRSNSSRGNARGVKIV